MGCLCCILSARGRGTLKFGLILGYLLGTTLDHCNWLTGDSLKGSDPTQTT